MFSKERNNAEAQIMHTSDLIKCCFFHNGQIISVKNNSINSMICLNSINSVKFHAILGPCLGLVSRSQRTEYGEL